MKSLKEKLKSNQVVIGGMITHFLRPAMIKIYAQCGFDFIYLENEHAMHNAAQVSDCVLFAVDIGIPVVVKPPYMDRGETARLLDSGVTGVQLPQTECRSQIDQFCSWAKYPPLGTRMVCCAAGVNNFGSLSASDLDRINDQTIVVAHIETKKGVANVEEIAECPFVDVVFVGQGDLSVSLGKPGDFHNPEHIAAVKKILSATKKAGKVPGIYAATADSIKQCVALGFHFIETTDEISFVFSGAKKLLAEIANT